MGRAKEWQLEQWERGYDEADGDICADCVSDLVLKHWVTDNAAAFECSFCGETSDEPLAASFDEFVGKVLDGVRFDWNHPDDEGIMYVSADGGYQASISDTWEVLEDYDISEDSDVLAAIVDVVGNDGWVQRDFYVGDKSQRLEWGWDRFKEAVKHEIRYVFLIAGEEEYGPEITPSRMLAAIGETVSDGAGLGLIKELPTDVDLFRIRVGQERYDSGSAIGTPPRDHATQSNRMSPAGIGMFYGAFDSDTARAETIDPNQHQGQFLSVGAFRGVRPLKLLDLANLPDIPSAFDEHNRRNIHPLRFLHAFARDIAKPIARDGREHIEYVPTQIVTEFFRRVFRDTDGSAIDGIVYESSRHPGRNAFVLFCEHEQCFPGDGPAWHGEQLVELVGVTHDQV